MKRYVRITTAGQGIATRRLIELLSKLKINHGVRRLTMNRLAGVNGEKQYQMEMYTR